MENDKMNAVNKFENANKSQIVASEQMLRYYVRIGRLLVQTPTSPSARLSDSTSLQGSR